MKIKIAGVLVSWLAVSLLSVSCLNDDTEITYSDDASITAFSIQDIETVLINDTDTVTFTTSGSDYPFTIDQLGGRIYNNDPLPYRTDIKKVALTISGSSGSFRTYTLKDRNGADSTVVWSSSDSLDFTSPVLFASYAPNGITNRVYEVKINVYQVDPDTLIWQRVEGSNYPGASIQGKQKAVCFQGKVFVFAESASQVEVASATDASTWTALTPLPGLNAKADYSSVMVFNGKLLIVAGSEVYSSVDGLTWQKEPVTATGLVSAFSDRLIAVNAGQWVEAVPQPDGTLQWNETGVETPAGFPEGGYISVTMPCATNNSIEQTVMISDWESTTGATTVWTVYSNQNQWVSYTTGDNADYSCPKLEDMAMIRYDNALYVFGGKGMDGEDEVEAFGGFYQSRDNGLVWKLLTEKMSFPEELRGTEASFSYVVDEDSFIWIMPSGSNVVWKGKVNRLDF